MINNDILNEEQKLMKKQMLLELKKELQKLEFETKYCLLINIEKDILKNTRIILKLIQCIMPYFLNIVAITGGMNFITHNTPFELDNFNILDLKSLIITLLYLLTIIGAEYLTYLLINDNPHFDLLLGIKNISELYPKLDTKELQRKLQIRKDNYERLTK